MVATFRGADSSPKELSINHNAGLSGLGGSSAIDAVVLRDRGVSTAWGRPRIPRLVSLRGSLHRRDLLTLICWRLAKGGFWWDRG